MEKKTFNQAAYVNEYKKKFYKQYAFRFSLKKDQAIICLLFQVIDNRLIFFQSEKRSSDYRSLGKASR